MPGRIELPVEKLRRLYVDEEYPSTRIAELFGCKAITVRKRLREAGIAIRQRGWHRRKRIVPDAILSQWPSAGLAYVVGLIASDGNLERDNNCVILSTTDRELADHFRILLGVPDLHVTVSRPPAPRSTSYSVQVCDFVNGWRQAGYLVAKFTSKSRAYLEWLQRSVLDMTGLDGRYSGDALVFNGRKAEALGRWMYYRPDLLCLNRKRLKWSEWIDGKTYG